MDEALRRLERGDEPLAYATALRRAGDDVRARRVVEARVRAGDQGARGLLDEWWPIDERVVRVVKRAMQPDQLLGRVLNWLFAEEDPRITSIMDPLITRMAAFADHPSADRKRVDEFVTLLRSPAEERREIALAGNNTMRLSRARLDPNEAASLLARSENARSSLLLSAIWHVRQARALVCTTSLLRHVVDDRLIAFEATCALHSFRVDASGPAPTLLAGLPFRPDWVVDHSPGETRDAETGALERSAFMSDPFTPLESGEAQETWVDGWLLSVAGPNAAQVATRVTRALHASVGDRVAVWGRGEWLIRLEPDLEPLPIAEGLRAVTGVPVSIGIARGTTWGTSILAAQSARTMAEQEGGDRVRMAL